MRSRDDETELRQRLEASEAHRVQAEEERERAERSRDSAEHERRAAEETRQAAEALRQAAEEVRQAAYEAQEVMRAQEKMFQKITDAIKRTHEQDGESAESPS